MKHCVQRLLPQNGSKETFAQLSLIAVDMPLEPGVRNFSSHALAVLWTLRNEGKTCDGVLRTEDGGEFQVHRVVMVTCSPYFLALFVDPVSTFERRAILIPGVSAEMLWEIIHFAYVRTTKIGWHNVYRLIEAADQFNVLDMLNDCCRFLVDNMNYKNCIGIRKSVSLYYCKELQDFAIRFLVTNIGNICKEKEFLELEIDEVTELLQMDNINVNREESIWEIGISWTDYDPDSRAKFIPNILNCLRLGLLKPKYFMEKIRDHRYVRGNENCRSIIIAAMKCIFCLDTEVGENSLSIFRKPRIPHEIIFVIGGWHEDRAICSVETYDPRTNIWTVMDKEIPCEPRAYHQCAVVEHNIYIIGGFDGLDYLNSCHCFDTVSLTWKEISPMFYKRCHVSVTSISNTIYAVGGNDGHRRLRLAERYLCDKNQWEIIPSMIEQRSDASAASMGGLVYVAGGFNGLNCLKSVEVYDPIIQEWTLVSPMTLKRSGLSCVSHCGYLYVLGGFTGLNRICSCEMYHPETDIWTMLPDMVSARSNFAAAVLEDTIFAIGGFCDPEQIADMECYDHKKRKWVKRAGLNLVRSGFSAVVVKGLPNATIYVPSRETS